MNKEKIVEAIQSINERYSQGISSEHIIALLELYGDSKIKEFKRIVVEELKDILEQDFVTKDDIRYVIESVMAIEV